MSIGELAQAVIAQVGGNKHIVADPERLRPESSEVCHLESDNRRAKELLGWSPEVDLATGLQRTIEYIRSNLSRYKTEIYNL